jgi:hypothetical protein
MLST